MHQIAKNYAAMKENRVTGEHEGQRSGGAVVNDMPGACQSRGVTELQREKGPTRNWINSHQKRLIYQAF